MDWTDRHCRFLHRLLTRHALLYTEMVAAEAVIHGRRERLLGFDATEHPVALQVGGSDPHKLAEGAVAIPVTAYRLKSPNRNRFSGIDRVYPLEDAA